MNQNKKDQWVLVTGAAKRLGQSLVESIHADGYCIMLHYYQSHAAAAAIQSKLNQQRADSCRIITADLRSNEATQAMCNQIIAQELAIFAVINNASIYHKTPATNCDIRHIDVEHFNTHIAMHMLAPWIISHAMRPSLEKTGGCIINMLDVYASKPQYGFDAYSTSKAALKMLTENMALSFAPHVRVNAIAPGAILWPEQLTAALDNQQQQALLDKIPLHKLGNTSAIAATARFLMHNDYIHGETIHVDGGLRLA